MNQDYFNSDQLDHMRSLDETHPSQLCYCGWHGVGNCATYPGSQKTSMDKLRDWLAKPCVCPSYCEHCRAEKAIDYWTKTTAKPSAHPAPVAPLTLDSIEESTLMPFDKAVAQPEAQAGNPKDCNCEHVHCSDPTCRSKAVSSGAVRESERICPATPAPSAEQLDDLVEKLRKELRIPCWCEAGEEEGAVTLCHNCGFLKSNIAAYARQRDAEKDAQLTEVASDKILFQKQRDWLIKECARVGVTVNVSIGAPLETAYSLVNEREAQIAALTKERDEAISQIDEEQAIAVQQQNRAERSEAENRKLRAHFCQCDSPYFGCQPVGLPAMCERCQKCVLSPAAEGEKGEQK